MVLAPIDMARAGHVFHHEGGAGQMLLHELRNQPAIKVVTAAGRGGDDVGHGLALVKIGAGLRACRRGSHCEGACHSGER